MNRNETLMFENLLLESGNWGEVNRRKVTSLVGLALQLLLVGILCLTSLYYTQSLPTPTPKLVTTLVAPPPLAAPASAKPASQMTKPAQVEARIDHKASPTPTYKTLTPTKMPEKVPIEDKDAPPPSPVLTDGVVGGIPGGVAGGKLGGILGGVASFGGPARAATPPARPQRVRVSEGLVGGLLVHKIMPSYPPSARQAHISGSVVLQAVISKEGSIEDVRVVQGDPLLTSAAMDAVKQWRYKPYFLNGQPVEVETIITVNFNLARG
jgi:protein TonB